MKFGEKIEEEQEVMMNLADIMIEIYAAESAILRAEQLVNLRGEALGKIQVAMAQVYLSEAVQNISKAAKECMAAYTSGDEQKVMLMGLRRFTKMELINTKKLRREIADFMVGEEKYPSFY
jgi:alkylation response protein AidB-like acyl-CoA dehydrogenase